MTVRKMTQSIGLAFMAILFGINIGNSQCTTFAQSEEGEEAKKAHVVYRDFIKAERYDEAFSYWETAFALAPAADGKRSTQYTDGVKLYTEKFTAASDANEKKMAAEKIETLYNQMAECYPKEKAFALGRMLYDMFYTINKDRAFIYDLGKKAIEAGGNASEYIVLIPTAHGLVDEYKAGKVEVQEARNVFTKLQEIADHNIANNAQFSDYYQQSKDGMNGVLISIESEIFDCDYFKNKYEASYKADPNNRELYRDIYKKLVQGGCDKDSDPLLKEIAKKDEVFLAAEKAAKIAELEASNPAWHAKRLFDEGDFSGAVAKYNEAITSEADTEKKASYYNSMASIQFRKLSQYGEARRNARKAAELKPGWGKPYVMIGDMYAKSARNCGDSWNQRLAILAAYEKYAYAKSIDSSVAGEASDRMSKYRSSFPDKNDGFMRGVTAGQSATVGCWIGETVKVRFSN